MRTSAPAAVFALAVLVLTSGRITAHAAPTLAPRLGPAPQQAGSDLMVNNIPAQPTTNPIANVGSQYSINGNQTWEYVFVGYQGGMGRVTHSAYTLTANQVFFVGDQTAGNGVYTLSNTGSLITPSDAYIGYQGGTGTFIQTGGSFTTNYRKIAVGAGSGSQGTFNLSGSNSVIVALGMAVGDSGGTGTFNQSDGNCTLMPDPDGTTAQGGLNLGTGANSQGTVNLSGGTMVTAPLLAPGIAPFPPPDSIIGTGGGTGTFHQTGGTYTSEYILVLGGSGGSGTYTLDAGNANLNTFYIGFDAGSPAVFNLNGGVLTTNQIAAVAGGMGTLHFNGGLLRAGRSDDPTGIGSPIFIRNLATADVRNGGARIDTAGYTNTVTSNLVHSTVSGDNATDGGLSLTGTGGTLTLAGTNTYTGATLVYAGTLIVSGSLSASPFVSVASGATLAITGSVSTGYLINSGRLRLTGTLNVPAGGTFNNNGVLDLINYAGALPAGFSNSSNGKIIRASDVRITQVARSAGTVQVTVGAFAGHTYQLQASAALGSAASWSNVGSSQVPTTDASLTFSDTAPGSGAQRFYRVLIAP